jgi:hypothetical protein
MEDKDLKELNDESRARGVKRSSEIKIAEVSTGKKKRAKKPTAEATEPDIAQNLFELPFERTEAYEMRSRLGDAARDVAEGKIILEEVSRAILDAVRDHNLRLADQGAFYNPLEEPQTIELDMEKFNRSAMAIARGRERIAALMRNAKPRPSSNINYGTSNISVEGSDRILLPQLRSHSCSPPHLTFLL